MCLLLCCDNLSFRSWLGLVFFFSFASLMPRCYFFTSSSLHFVQSSVFGVTQFPLCYSFFFSISVYISILYLQFNDQSLKKKLSLLLLFFGWTTYVHRTFNLKIDWFCRIEYTIWSNHCSFCVCAKQWNQSLNEHFSKEVRHLLALVVALFRVSLTPQF